MTSCKSSSRIQQLAVMAVPLFVLQKEKKNCYRRRQALEDLSEFEIKKHTGLPFWVARELIELYSSLEGARVSALPLETT